MLSGQLFDLFWYDLNPYGRRLARIIGLLYVSIVILKSINLVIRIPGFQLGEDPST